MRGKDHSTAFAIPPSLSRAVLAWTLLAALALPACVHRPAKVVSPAPVPARFSASGKAPLADRWWRSLGDPDLDRLVETALRRNMTLRQAWDRLAQARALARKMGAGLYPELDAQAGAKGTLSSKGHSVELSVGLVASYEVDLWGRVRSERDAERLAAMASREDLAAAAITLSAEVALAWIQLLGRRAHLLLLGTQRELSRKVLAVVTLQFEAGQGAAADVLQQRQNLESIAGDEAAVRGQIQVLLHQLSVLLGRPPGDTVAPERASLPPLPPLPDTGLPTALLGRRPDVRAALRRVEEADQRLGVALADRWPRLTLSAGAGVSATYGPAFLWGWLANLAANLVAPLVDGGARRAEVDRVRAKAAEALHRYGQVVLSSLKEVEDALARERQLGLQAQSLERQLRLSADVVDQVRGAYLQGAHEYLRVLDALLRHQALERSLLAARQERLEQRVALCRALAGGWALPAPTSDKRSQQASASDGPATAHLAQGPRRIP